MAPAKAKVKRRLNIKKIFIFFFLLGIVTYLTILAFNYKITNIYVENNNYYSDWEVIKAAKLNDYPAFLTTICFLKENTIKKNIEVDDVQIKKHWFGKLTIKITEKNILFYDSSNKVYVTQLEKLKENPYPKNNYPILVNYVPDTDYDSLIEKMSLIKTNILSKISEITYEPNDIDKTRFLLAMRDGNYVYLTLNKWDRLNKYEAILKTLPPENGILYLDYGNYFVPGSKL